MANQIHHYNAVTLRVVGSGDLDMSLVGFSDVDSNVLVTLPLQNPWNKEPTRLANFNAQRARLVGTMTELNEWFRINSITLWVKPVATSYPM
jgi:hypothetical protein